MRIDGRKNDQTRNIKFTPSFLNFPTGSAMVEFGRTRVLCSAVVTEEVPPWMRAQKKPGGWLTAEYQMIPGSTSERSKRETTKISGRTQEIQRLVGRSLRSALNLEKIGQRTIYIDCEVLDADGGTRCASVCGGMLALRLAVEKMLADGTIAENPISSYVAALSLGIVEGEVMLDLCYQEDSNADVDMNVIMNEKGNFIELQATAEKRSFNDGELAQMLSLARTSVANVIQTIKTVKA